jgi:hypothetical protein
MLCKEDAFDKAVFDIAFGITFRQILNFFFFVKIEYGLYFLDRFDVLMSKIIFKNKKTSLACISA